MLVHLPTSSTPPLERMYCNMFSYQLYPSFGEKGLDFSCFLLVVPPLLLWRRKIWMFTLGPKSSTPDLGEKGLDVGVCSY